MEYTGEWMDTWNEIVDTYNQETDRSAAILSSSFLDEFLKDCIQTFLVDDPKVSNLFESYNPLGSFSAKVSFAYALGFMNDEIERDLYFIRKIRNHFAHHPKVTSFDISPVKDFCSNLSSAKPRVINKTTLQVTEPKKQFLSAVSLTIVRIHNIRTGQPQRTKPTYTDQFMQTAQNETRKTKKQKKQ